MKQTIRAFESYGVSAFYHSLDPRAKRERWAKREAKISARKNKLSRSTVEQIIDGKPEDLQPSLFMKRKKRKNRQF